MTDPHHPFDGLRPARPPHDLRRRAVAAARRGAASALPARPNWIDIVWKSRVARVAYAGALLLALALNAPAVRPRPGERATPDHVVVDGLELPIPGHTLADRRHSIEES